MGREVGETGVNQKQIQRMVWLLATHAVFERVPTAQAWPFDRRLVRRWNVSDGLLVCLLS